MLEMSASGCRTGCGRRGFLKVGTLAFGGLTLPEVLRARQAQPSGGRAETAVILLWMTGGPSHIDMYDMKPEAPEVVRGPFRPIATNLPGLEVCELMPGHARIADRLAVVRSLRHTFTVHNDAQHLVQTGYPQPNALEAGQTHPCQGAVASLLRGPVDPALPAYVCIPEDYSTHTGFYQTAAFLGPRHNAVDGGGDPSLGNYHPPHFSLPADVTVSRLEDRRALARGLDGLRRRVEQDGSLEAMDAVQRQAFDLVLGAKARQAFDLSREPEAVQAKYGRDAWGRFTLLARRLVEAGVTFVTVNQYEKDVDWWDDHDGIEPSLRKRLPMYDRVLTALIEDLHERGLSERVLVLACGEFGRTPRINRAAGRDHWPQAMHAVLSGGGIRTGQVIGSTTRDAGEPKDRALSPGDLLASVYRVLGIDPHAMVADRQARPLRVIQEGEPIEELFA